MIITQKPDCIKKLIGYNEKTGVICDLPLVCIRKPLYKKRIIKKPYLIFVSNPNFMYNEYNPYMWLHCFRNDINSKKPQYLLPESDFVDKMFVPCCKNSVKYDYCYFTLNDSRGIDYKGFDVFLKSLEVFNDLQLKGVVVSYHGASGKWIFNLTDRQKKLMNSIDVIWHSLNRQGVSKIMSSCKFVFFPNKRDCSPRMIPESFIHDKPVVVNKNIYGGWHYINNNELFGSLFSPDDGLSLERSIKHVMKLKNNQSQIWHESYGFDVSARKLSDLVKKHFKYFDTTHVYFEDFKEVFCEKKKGIKIC